MPLWFKQGFLNKTFYLYDGRWCRWLSQYMVIAFSFFISGHNLRNCRWPKTNSEHLNIQNARMPCKFILKMNELSKWKWKGVVKINTTFQSQKQEDSSRKKDKENPKKKKKKKWAIRPILAECITYAKPLDGAKEALTSLKGDCFKNSND